MGRRGGERDILRNKTKPKTKPHMWTAKDTYGYTSMSLYSSVSTPEKNNHHQEQSTLQAALQNTKEHEDTHFYLLTANAFNLLTWQIK